MNRWIAPPMFVATLFVLTGCRTYSAEQRFDLTAPWKGCQRIVVRSPTGSVALRTADVPEIRISGTRRASAYAASKAEDRLKHVRIIAEPDASEPSALVVRVRHPWWLASGSVGASFNIQVPGACAADIRTRNGTIVVSGLKDEAILKTSRGDVTIDDVTGSVRARTCNGMIVAENVTGSLTAETSNGRIRAKTIQGNCELTTSNGRIEAEDIHGGVEAKVSNGDIRADVIPPENGSVVLRTRNGSIHVTLPADLEVDLDLRTNNGVVQTALPNASMRVQHWSQNRVRAAINGGGGARIVATTSSGSITLESR